MEADMPNCNGRGPEGTGPMTGKGLGLCGGAAVMSPRSGHGMGNGMGRGNGPGCGFGLGHSRGLGRGTGWFSIGYDDTTSGADLTGALQRKRVFLLAELGRTEALLGVKPMGEASRTDKEAEK